MKSWLFLVIVLPNALAALFLWLHFGTVNLCNISDIGILRVQFEVVVTLAFFYLIFDLTSGGYTINSRRDLFAFFVFQVVLVSLVCSFIWSNFFFFVLVMLFLISAIMLLVLWEKEDIPVVEIIESD